jgi:hypothetical protein
MKDNNPIKKIEIAPEMVDRAMHKLSQYPVASEFVDRYMMKEFLVAAIKEGSPDDLIRRRVQTSE